ncbi:phage portal protein family protein, partial [Marinobacter sp.]|uniref:phage portal protein family protein n=1 Tax=Marinobacter sp. TaxID=50741 RepID=UPI002B49C515
ILPSDPYMDSEGKPSNHKLMDFKLASSEGSRNIDLDPVIKRYQHDIARSFLTEFIMLGVDGGSYALSKSKTDLFLRALESYIQSIVDVLNRQLVERLWQLNGLDYNLMPKITAGDIAPHDLKELGSYLRNLNGADISLADQTDIVDSLLENAELPALDRGIYEESRKRARRTEAARADYYDDDSTPGDGPQESEEDGENSVGDNAGDE